MEFSNRILVLATVLAALMSLPGCGSDSQATDTEAEAVVVPSTDGPGTDQTDHDNHDNEAHADHDDEERSAAGSGLGAHEHGVAELSVAWNESDMVIDLISPTHNIFGFEHKPTSDEDQSIVADRTDALSAPNVLIINTEAGCTLADDVTTELEFEESHAELTASWSYRCENPADIRQLDAAKLFAEFPNLEDIDAQWASASGQSSAELSPTATVLSFE